MMVKQLAMKLLLGVLMTSNFYFYSSEAYHDPRASCGDKVPIGCEPWNNVNTKLLGRENDGILLREFSIINPVKFHVEAKYKSLMKPGGAILHSVSHLYSGLIHEVVHKTPKGDIIEEVEIEKFGPLAIRGENSKSWQDYTSIPGYLKRDSEDTSSYLRFFMPKLNAVEHFYEKQGKHDFGHKLITYVHCCKSADVCCEPEKTVADGDSKFVSIYPENTRTLIGELSNAVLDLNSKKLSFVYSGGDTNVKLGYCPPKAFVILYESNPRATGFNSRIRPILAKVEEELTFRSLRTSKKFSFILGEGEADGGFYESQVDFLRENEELTSSMDEFYRGWYRQGGLDIAFTVCECFDTVTRLGKPVQNPRKCREYKHQQVEIKSKLTRN